LLRITTQESESSLELTLEGRLAGPWVEELSRAWTELAPRLDQRKLSLDLRNVTYADVAGKAVLRAIVAESKAEIVASSPWTQYLAEEIIDNT
jgi:ABC-type transporter Mla MlaB component